MKYKGDHIYQPVVYSIIINKYLTVGLIEQHNYELGVSNIRLFYPFMPFFPFPGCL